MTVISLSHSRENLEAYRPLESDEIQDILVEIEAEGEKILSVSGYHVPISHAFTPSWERFNYGDPHARERLERYLASLKEGSDFYFDVPTGFLVMSALKHIKRGFCCNSGCRHCPYIER